MKFALLSLAATASALAPRDNDPTYTYPIQSPGETPPSATLSVIEPIVSFSPIPSTDSVQVTVPPLTTASTHTTHTMPPIPSSGSSSSSPSMSSNTDSSTESMSSTMSEPTTTQDSSSSQATSPTGSSGTGTTGSTSGSQTSNVPTDNAAAVPTANVMAGIAAIAGLVMVA